ncbi:hypothetical protein LIER_07577 [Lithospermum erythrorhizon]|uniref:MULE transposase domain-containing protein n=1 Tax=Lithospermum erythrorhizon TaxID=34254 RepID=A0AAV3P8M0_LITER
MAAGYLMYGNENQKFARLWSYAKEMIDIIPGSTVIIKQEEQKFQRIYVCPSPLKKDFLAGCRRFLCLDGCFLKGAFKGQILAVVGLVADKDIYPVAWAVVEVENTDSWTWFVRLLKEDLMMDREPDSSILMTDQQKIAIKNELPDAVHRLCVKHLHANSSKRFTGKTLKKMMLKCVRAANEPYFKVKMQQLRNVIVEGYEALRCIDLRKWARYAFRPGRNCA